MEAIEEHVVEPHPYHVIADGAVVETFLARGALEALRRRTKPGIVVMDIAIQELPSEEDDDVA